MQFILNKFNENTTLFNINPNHLLLGLNILKETLEGDAMINHD